METEWNSVENFECGGDVMSKLQVKTTGAIYLNTEKGIRLDFDGTKIIYEKDHNREVLLRQTQEERFLLLLLSYPGMKLANSEICSAVGSVASDKNETCRKLALKARKLLNLYINGEEKNKEGVPEIIGKTELGMEIGTHTILLPQEAQTAMSWVEEHPEQSRLAENYWKQYAIVRPFKNSGRSAYQDNILFHEVYRIPRLRPDASEEGRIWQMREFRGNRNLIYVEAPNGYGKSTLLQDIVLSSLYGNQCQTEDPGVRKWYEKLAAYHGLPEGAFVVLLQTENLHWENGAELECLYTSNPLHQSIGREQFEELIRYYNKKEKLFILIDGYDEAEMEQQEQVIRWIQQISGMEKYQDSCGKAVFLVAGRSLYENEGQNPITGGGLTVHRWHLSALDPQNTEEVDQLLTRYAGHLRNRKPDTVERTKERIRTNPYLSRLPVTPFILVKMVEDCSRNDRNDLGTYEVIDRVIDQLMKRQKRFGLTRQELFKYKVLHEELAFQMLTDGEEGMDYEYFSRYVSSGFQQAEQYFQKNWGMPLATISAEDVFTITGLLQENADGRVGFLSSYVLTREFAARKLTRLMESESIGEDRDTAESERIGKACGTMLGKLSELPVGYRYELLIMSMVQLMKNICYEGYFFHGFSPAAAEEAMTVFENYILDRYAQSSDGAEKEAIREAVGLLFSNAYGNIPLTNINNIAEEKLDVEMRKALQQILQDTSPAKEGENCL